MHEHTQYAQAYEITQKTNFQIKYFLGSFFCISPVSRYDAVI